MAIKNNTFDTKIRPADDFFAYVNNDWLKRNSVPPEEARWGSFYVMRVEVETQLKQILEDIGSQKESALDADAVKIRNFYNTGMDLKKRNLEKDAPLKDLYDVINAISSVPDLIKAIGYLHRRGVGAFWVPFADQDAKQSEMMAFHLYQGGLSLPDRDYYLKEDEKSAEIRKKYLNYAEGMTGRAPKHIMEIETLLAKASMTRVELRDVEKQYNKMTLADLVALAPSINWPSYFEVTGIKTPEYLIVCQPEFMKEVDRFISTAPIDHIKEYLRWHALNSLASFLSEDFEKKAFDFYGRTFAGATEMKPLWRRVLGVVNSLLDEALGKLYVERHFSEDAKHKITVLVDHLIAAYRVRIEKLDWMGAATKEKALAKLSTVSKKLGYPDKWRDISALEIGTDSYAANYIRAYSFEFDRQMRKVGKPVDRSEWLMPPQMVNAYYQPTMNEIAFPAAILQSPFFDPNADDAVNYGGIGTVIGHELTHGFDDQGALYDLNGNLQNWWTKEDKERFDKQTGRLAEQYDKYEPIPGLHINGKLTLGENIADLGGLLIAYDGLQLALKEKPAAETDGFTPNQRFFINYAITERSNIREEALRLQVQTDPHSPSKYRVNGPLSNMQAFYEAFSSKAGDALYRDPEDRVKIW